MLTSSDLAGCPDLGTTKASYCTMANPCTSSPNRAVVAQFCPHSHQSPWLSLAPRTLIARTPPLLGSHARPVHLRQVLHTADRHPHGAAKGCTIYLPHACAVGRGFAPFFSRGPGLQQPGRQLRQQPGPPAALELSVAGQGPGRAPCWARRVQVKHPYSPEARQPPRTYVQRATAELGSGLLRAFWEGLQHGLLHAPWLYI
jgi:hypothetical protein